MSNVVISQAPSATHHVHFLPSLQQFPNATFCNVNIRTAEPSELMTIPEHTKLDYPKECFQDKRFSNPGGCKVQIVASYLAEGVINRETGQPEILFIENPQSCLKYGDKLERQQFYSMTTHVYELSKEGADEEPIQFTQFATSGTGAYEDLSHMLNNAAKEKYNEIMAKNIGDGNKILEYQPKERQFFNSDPAARVTSEFTLNKLADSELYNETGNATEANKIWSIIQQSCTDEACDFPQGFKEKHNHLHPEAQTAYKTSADMIIAYFQYMQEHQNTDIDNITLCRTSKEEIELLIKSAEEKGISLNFRMGAVSGKNYTSTDTLSQKPFTQIAYLDVSESMSKHGLSKLDSQTEEMVQKVAEQREQRSGYENHETGKIATTRPCLLGYSYSSDQPEHQTDKFAIQAFLAPPPDEENTYRTTVEQLATNSDALREKGFTAVITNPVTQKQSLAARKKEVDTQYTKPITMADNTPPRPFYFTSSISGDTYSTNQRASLEVQLEKLIARKTSAVKLS